jgi:hypothetical protein
MSQNLQTSSIPYFSASNAFHHGEFSGRGTWNLRAAAYTTPQATTALLKQTHKVVRKLHEKVIDVEKDQQESTPASLRKRGYNKQEKTPKSVNKKQKFHLFFKLSYYAVLSCTNSFKECATE